MPYKNKNDPRKKRFHERNRNYKDDYKRSHPCVDCGNSDIRVLEFDHVRGIKLLTIANTSSFSFSRLVEEIDKCDVRCANCHRIKTYIDREEKIRCT